MKCVSTCFKVSTVEAEYAPTLDITQNSSLGTTLGNFVTTGPLHHTKKTY